jgi:hypothetical protein
LLVVWEKQNSNEVMEATIQGPNLVAYPSDNGQDPSPEGNILGEQIAKPALVVGFLFSDVFDLFVHFI